MTKTKNSYTQENNLLNTRWEKALEDEEDFDDTVEMLVGNDIAK